VANTCDGGFGDETEDLLRCSEESLQQGLPVCFAAFLRIHHVNKLLGGPLKVLQLLLALLQLLLALLLFFAQCLDLRKAVDELLLSVGNNHLQPLNIIYTVIQHILHVSKQLFFIC
jgi:hypothetical protein